MLCKLVAIKRATAKPHAHSRDSRRGAFRRGQAAKLAARVELPDDVRCYLLEGMPGALWPRLHQAGVDAGRVHVVDDEIVVVNVTHHWAATTPLRDEAQVRDLGRVQSARAIARLPVVAL
jgi:hypothetical protein